MPKPIPVPDEVSKPFWEACNQNKLIVQYCTTDQRWQYPPAKVCAQCAKSENLEWRQTSGKGHILDYIVIYDARVRAFRAEQPVNLAVVTMDEDPGINFLSNLPGRRADDVPVGAAVSVIFVPSIDPKQLVHEWQVVS